LETINETSYNVSNCLTLLSALSKIQYFNIGISQPGKSDMDHQVAKQEAEEYLRSVLPATVGTSRDFSEIDLPDKLLYGRIIGYIYPRDQRGIKDVPMSNILHAIALRVIRQSAVLATYMHLHKEGLLTTIGLQTAVQFSGDFQRGGTNLSRIWCTAGLLRCFQLLRVDCVREMFMTGTEGYDFPVLWLSTMIVRGVSNFTGDALNVYNRLLGQQKLGHFSQQIFDVWIAHGQDPMLSRPLRTVMPSRQDEDKICFWLPHGLGDNVDLDAACDSFDRKYRAFDHVFGGFLGYPMMVGLPPHRKYCTEAA
jgi:hypothetical protein